ncbi:hypothetical protein [Haloferula sp. A504]|uniref:hypothetical protein n=1 Tax=Haloferula sp. A504 TaxID=3373601 RepID=UPI0031C1CD94|nr:hypothetical protein [Verrucomicrobiaceae bacterium E54]
MAEEKWICPGCGAELRVGVKGCPTCSKPSRRRKPKAAKVRRSWEQEAAHDGLDLPDDDFDYDDFVKREFGKAPHRRVPIRWYWWLTAVVLLVLMAWAGGRLF